MIGKLLGFLLLLECLFLLPPALISAMDGEQAALKAIFSTMVLSAGAGAALWLGCRNAEGRFYAREGFLIVSLGWILLSAVGALPFWLSGEIPHYVDAVFEVISGFTTTGSTILTDIEALPKGILFWRAFTHWLGGMGVLVLATAIVPKLGIRSHYLTQAETPGPVFSKLVPKQSKTSKILYAMYCTLTLVEVACLKIAGMPLYDSFIHAFSTAGTGGFSNRNASVGAYDSVPIDVIITVFMLLFSVNFAVYFLILTGKAKQALKSDELRFFVIMVAASTAAIAWNLRDVYQTVGDCVRYAAFQVASIVSTTGFASANYDLWPEFSKMLLVVLTFIGACAGSTGGGIKCSRILILVRSAAREVRSIIHPRAVSVVRLDGAPLSEATLHTTQCYFIINLFLVFGSAIVVGLDNFSFGTTLTAVITCISNVGPGLELVGPAGNFAAFSVLSKLVLSFAMILGRLEMYPILVLFSNSAWKRS